MRAFISINLPPELYPKIVRLQDELLDGVKCTRPNHFHITLSFLGEVGDAESIVEELKKVEFEPFELSLDSIGFFPKPNYIRVVYLNVNPHPEIAKLYLSIAKALDIKQDKRFNPHITIARIKNIPDKRSFIEKCSNMDIDERFKVTDFSLMRSTLTPKGPIYEVIASF